MDAIRAMIFDMDGVIADSEPLHFEAEQKILRQYGIEAPWSEWDRFAGLTDQTIFHYIVENFTDGSYSVAELIKAKYNIFLSILSEKLQPIPGALNFIRWARECYPKLALTTSSVQEVQETVFRILDLQSYFDVVITGDHIQHSKPHPEPYLITVKALEVPAQACMVLEDSLHGIKSAKEAGCNVTGITTTFSEEELLEAGADRVIETFSSFVENV